jgi:hypothetical protein
MTEMTKEEKVTSELKKKFDDMSETELTEVYKKFQKVSTILYRVSELETEIDNLKESITLKSSRTQDLIYLIIFGLVTISLFYFDKIEYTVIVMFIYFSNEIFKEIRKNKSELLLNLKNTQKYQLQLECLIYGFEMNDIEGLVRDIKKIPRMMDNYDYFFKDINRRILYELNWEKDVRSNIEHLLMTENKYYK